MSDVENRCPQPLWLVASLVIPPHPRRRQGGRRRHTDDRAVLAAIPASFGVSTTAAHRRFTEWVNIGLFTLPRCSTCSV